MKLCITCGEQLGFYDKTYHESRLSCVPVKVNVKAKDTKNKRKCRRCLKIFTSTGGIRLCKQCEGVLND